MTAIEHIQAFQQSKLTDEDNNRIIIELLPALSPEQINALEKGVNQPLPEELRTLLAYCSGINGLLSGINFTGAGMSLEVTETFPNGLPFAGDGYGNFWVLDITPSTTKTAPIFFVCHDAPVILYQSPNIASFLGDLFRSCIPPHDTTFHEIHSDRIFKVYKCAPGVIKQPVAAISPDPVISAFALELPDDFLIVDLRQVAPGMGVLWEVDGKHATRRYNHERIFAYRAFTKPSNKRFCHKLSER